MQRPKVLVLGAGFVGKCLSDLENQYEIIFTRRKPEKGEIQFDITERATWSNLPAVDEENVVITFNLALFDQELLDIFWNEVLARARRVLVYSTTGIYLLNDDPNQIVSEKSKLGGGISKHSGVNMEDRIRNEQMYRERGAIILPLSGIFGRTRPISKYFKYIKNGDKLVNWIHVDDIVQITGIMIQAHQLPFSMVSVTSGHYLWKDLAEAHGMSLTSAGPDSESKIVDNSLLKEFLGEDYKFNSALISEKGNTRIKLGNSSTSRSNENLSAWEVFIGRCFCIPVQTENPL